MARGYVEISEADMRAKLEGAMGFEEVFAANTRELMFQRLVDDRFAVRVYSSVAKGTTRVAGKDAIRVAIYDTVRDKPVKLERRVNRTERALDNMTLRARELWVAAKRGRCSCNQGIMLERESRTGSKFLGCSAFPACKNTLKCG